MKKTSKVKLPFNIRNELRMLCAMKGYSSMKGGKGKTLMQQYDTLYAYYHGKEPSRPSQIKILCSGGYGYGDLYDSIQKVATSKSASTETTEELVLKKDLHRDPTRVFRAKKEINYLDLEKKSASSPLLVTGRTLLALAKTGHKNYKRALSFAEQKWDFVKGVEKDSGTTIDDVLLFVRQGMYDYMNKNKDSSSDVEDIGDAKVDKTDNTTAVANSTITEEVAKDSSDSCDDSVVEVPDNFIFPGYMAFYLWGPFAAPEDRLIIFESKDAPKNKGALSRASKRKLELANKDVDRASEDHSQRGFSTDQQISLEGLILQRKMHRQQELDATTVALIAHESAIARQIEAAERRANQRCPQYTPTNVYWQAVDTLVSKQVEINTRMDALTKSVAVDEEVEGDSIVTRFLNQESPNRKAKLSTPGDDTNPVDIGDDSSCNDGDDSPNKEPKCDTTGDDVNPVDIGDDSSCDDGDVSDGAM